MSRAVRFLVELVVCLISSVLFFIVLGWVHDILSYDFHILQKDRSSAVLFALNVGALSGNLIAVVLLSRIRGESISKKALILSLTAIASLIGANLGLLTSTILDLFSPWEIVFILAASSLAGLSVFRVMMRVFSAKKRTVS